jgi:exodeoxyribonuclease V alpha subunit
MGEDNKSFVRGTCVSTLFHNPDNLYSVIKLKIIDTNESIDSDEIMVVGYISQLQREEDVTVYGKKINHPKYGQQYQISSYTKEMPKSTEGLVQYFSSDIFKGIGKKTAEKLVAVLGEDCIPRILSNPDILIDKVGLKEDKRDIIVQALEENQGMEQLLIFLSSFGISISLAMKIYQKYKELTREIIQENPYRLMLDIEGIGFQKADEIARNFSFDSSHPMRIQAAILYVLNQLTFNDGHVFVDSLELFDNTLKLIGYHTDDEILIEQLKNLTSDNKVIIKDSRIYLASAYYSELGIARNIERLQNDKPEVFPEAEILKLIGSYEESNGIYFSEQQQEAIRMPLNNPVSIITGGPGTGKTTVVRGLINAFIQLHGIKVTSKGAIQDKDAILLAAPTGRAAKRLSDSTELPATTIHKLLGWTREGNFTFGDENKLEGKLLIVDEFSMVDIFLANQLLKSVPQNMQVVFVGDEDQLPSVGPGQVLKDLLKSMKIPAVKLKQIYRQNEGSTIIDLAYAINSGEVNNKLLNKSEDFAFVKCHTTQILDGVIKVCENAIKKGYTQREIQVLAPMYKGPAGIDELNSALQKLFNPKRDKVRELAFGDKVYRTGDKVLQLVNQPENNIFNGDIGEVVGVFYAKETQENQDQLIVSFDGNEVTIPKSDLIQLTHAYCCSIHKSQGSEYPLVVLPLSRGYSRMLRRNLLYTAVTRSKDYLILCGEEDAFYIGVNRKDDSLRKTSLSELLNNEIKIERPLYLTESYINSPLVEQDELDRINGISPYDFV